MKIKVFTFIMASLLLGACAKRHKFDKLHYYQDFEALKGWMPSPAITDEVTAHSGIYTTQTSKEYPYSQTLQLQSKELGTAQVKKIKISAWCYFKSKSCEGGLCLQIVNPANENKLWASSSLKDLIKEEGKWIKVTTLAEVNESMLNAENTIKVFVWNTGSDKIYADDFEVEFIE